MHARSLEGICLVSLPFEVNMKICKNHAKIRRSRDSTVHCRNVRGLGKSVVVFRLFEKLRYSNERSTKLESFKQE